MKTFHLVITLMLFAASARGNLYIPNAKLAGETVHIRLSKDAALVTAIFEFEELATRDAKLVYFPIFADNTSDPVRVLATAGCELEVNGKKQGIATPCAAPNGLGSMPNSPRVCWFSANIDDLIEDSDADINSPIVIKVSYTQLRIHGTVHYLPVIVGASGESRQRSWKYQMLAYSGSRVTQVVSNGTDYEQLADSVVIYLKDRNLVELK